MVMMIWTDFGMAEIPQRIANRLGQIVIQANPLYPEWPMSTDAKTDRFIRFVNARAKRLWIEGAP
jgi:hypothetical protein